MSDLGHSETSLITDEMVDRALRVYAPGMMDRQRYPSAVREARAKMRAALQAVEGDIIEALGASGHAVEKDLAWYESLERVERADLPRSSVPPHQPRPS